MPETSNTPQKPQRISLLTGIGLVLAGLLAGILIMLFVINGQMEDGSRRPIVERVELGNRSEAPHYRPADSLANEEDQLSGLTSLSESFQFVASNVTPAVVYIRVEMADSGSERGWLPRFGQPRQSVGSGVIISETGYIVTNNHVVEGADEVTVTLDDKRQYAATVVGTDPSTDLAVLKAKTNDTLPSAIFGNSDNVSVGEWVIAVGNPFRLTSTVTAGIVSALGRQVNIIEDAFGIEDFIQTDAAINPGNSGGALVNVYGELIGINTAIATESGSYEGYGFAVPVNLVERVVEDLIAYGEVQRGYLGVTISPIDAASARRFGLDRITGVQLSVVDPLSAAAKAGLEVDDVVLSIEGREVSEPNELQRVVAIHRPGDRLKVEVWRNNAMRVFHVELFGKEDASYRAWTAALDQQAEDRDRRRAVPEIEPESFGADTAFEIEEWGIGIKQLTDQVRTQYDVPHGVYIAFVRRGGEGAKARLPRDVVLLEVNGETVYSLESALTLFETVGEQGEPVLFRVKHKDGRIAFYEAEPLSLKEGTPE
ncbi:MAG: trypsin-like peptidase domain-containing protein [Bacteroidota bacterium]